MNLSQVQAVSVAGELAAQPLIDSSVRQASNVSARGIGSLNGFEGLLEVGVLLGLHACVTHSEEQAEQAHRDVVMTSSAG